jgi:predicted NACHT family NTPase
LDPECQSLTEWLASHLVAEYSVRTDDARALIEQDRMLPLLDGLDELPEGIPAAVIEAITRSASNNP